MTAVAPIDDLRARALRFERERVARAIRAELQGQAPERPAIDRYEVLRKLGEGAQSIVYEARDTMLGRLVALKLRTHARAGAHAALDEARALARIEHPNLLPVYDAGLFDGIPYLVTERLTGGTLRTRFAGPLSVGEARTLVADTARGVAALHQRGLVHDDLKPENVFVTGTHAKVGDFGLAAEPSSGPASVSPGTARYASPERLRGGRADPWSDQHALSVLAFELLFGAHPRLADDGSERAAPFVVPTLHPHAALEPMLRKGMHDDPAMRHPTVDAWLVAFESATAGVRTATRRRVARVAAFGLVAGLVGVAFAARVVLTPPAAAAGVRGPAASPAAPELSDEAAADAEIFSALSPVFAGQRWDECVRYLATHARTHASRTAWLRCAERRNDVDQVDAACRSFGLPDGAPDLPEECDALRRAALRDLVSGHPDVCFDRLVAAPPTMFRMVTLSACNAALTDRRDEEVCRKGMELRGDPDPARACGELRSLDDR